MKTRSENYYCSLCGERSTRSTRPAKADRRTRCRPCERRWLRLTKGIANAIAKGARS